MGRAPIAIVGGAGAVGRALTGQLEELALAPLRIGMRQQNSAAQGRGEIVLFDIDDDKSLARFCYGAAVVVNCAGPASRILDKIAKAALETGAAYVDPGGDDGLLRMIGERGEGRAVIGAGMMPGLTGLLPRWLAGRAFDRVRRMTAYVATRDFFTPAAATDFLASLGGAYGSAMAAWRNGAPAVAALKPLIGIELPFFPGRVNAFPYMTREAERLAAALGLAEASWYMMFEGGQMWKALREAAPAERIHESRAAEALARAARMDLFGQKPRQAFVVEMEGEANGGPAARTLLARSDSTYELSAAIAAQAVRALLCGEIGPGARFAADILDPSIALAYARNIGALTALDILESGAKTAGEIEQDWV